MSGLSALALFLGSIVWLAALIVSGFSLLAVSIGLLTFLWILGGIDGSGA